ncbi:NAD(P)-dependent oxidoreductase [Cohnella sp. REN36]|uniref:NAD-dependent epimerase/dehydratase family protein n=1 Tax=Cohnella sp. REN36 TaxID=2887347 RepID=UPI001D132D5D|nr:NAD-dependent epimerase/dehydratase family protein [Cohnella sp. REN36]MCC3374104.1 NAD-dependent epimerase/dehydratase family protein [Cohnella sp. REN36]
MKKEICLVTGGAGFIGSKLSQSLVDVFDEVIVIDSLHPQIHKNSERPVELDSKVNLMVADICDGDMWDAILEKAKPTVIIHLAAETGTGQSLTEATRHANVNVVGTTQMLDALVRNRAIPRKIILSSSRAVYGEGRWKPLSGQEFYPGQRTQEQLENQEWDFIDSKYLPMNSKINVPMPTSIYGSTKLAQENIISSWCKSFSVDFTVLRFQNVYGPGQSLINSYTGIVSLFVRMAKENKSIPLYEDGNMLRDFIYITDVSNSIMAVLPSEKAINGAVFDIGSGYAATIKEVAYIIAHRYGAPEPHVCGKYRNGDVRHASCDISDTRDFINWTPQISLNEGLGLLCDWIDQKLQ